jgi:uncharacterized damage-inducible protein DinB
VSTNPIFPATLQDHIAELERARARLLEEIGNCQVELAMRRPEPGTWSLTEIIYHLHLSERGITRMIQKALSGERGPVVSQERLQEEWERVRQMVGSRQEKAQAPPATKPENVPGFSEALELLGQSRKELLDLISRVSLDDLASICKPHPLKEIGTLTGATWLSLIAFHELRHAEQISDLRSVLGD